MFPSTEEEQETSLLQETHLSGTLSAATLEAIKHIKPKLW